MKIIHDDAPTGARFAAATLAACVSPSPGFVTFCGLPDGPSPPHFSEWSASIAPTLQLERLTHYFDVRDDAARDDACGAFEAAACALAIDVPARLSDVLHGPLRRAPALAQFVVGYDGGAPGSPARLKLYALFDGPSAAHVARLVDAAGAAVPAGLELDQVFLVGLDLHPGRVSDAKLYLRVPRASVGRAVRRGGPHDVLLAHADELVLAVSCAAPARRQLHIHTGRVAAQRRHLEALAAGHPPLAAALAHAGRASERLAPHRLLPYVVGLALERAELSLTRANVYFHPTADPAAIR